MQRRSPAPRRQQNLHAHEDAPQGGVASYTLVGHPGHQQRQLEEADDDNHQYVPTCGYVHEMNVQLHDCVLYCVVW